jgi:hypothetical protein
MPSQWTASTVNKGVFALNLPGLLHRPQPSPDDSISISDDDDVSTVDAAHSSQALLFTPWADFFTPLAAVPAPVRRAANPSVLNDDWRTFFRDAFIPTTTEPPATTNDAPPNHTLPSPLTKAPNLPCRHPFLPDYRRMRMWSNNINGLSPDNGFAALHDLCIALTPHDVGAIALQETNLDFTKQFIRDAVESILSEHFGAVGLVTSTSCVRSPSAWKPGGVLLAILEQWSHSVSSTHSDDLGRWASATFTGRDNRLFTLYSVYNCVDVRITDVGPPQLMPNNGNYCACLASTRPTLAYRVYKI